MGVLIEYGVFWKNLFLNFINNYSIFFLIFICSFMLASILCSFLAKSIYDKMHYKINPIIWIPVLNIYYISGKSVHSIVAILMVIETILLIPIPHPLNGVWLIESLCPGNFQTLMLIALVIEIVFSLVYLVVNYIKYDYELKIVR